MTEPSAALRVLLVEDEPMIAMMVENVIDDLGFRTVGPVARLDQAMKLAAEGAFDCAILDINIRGGRSYGIADLLLERGCPFLMATGYSDWSMPPHLIGQKKLTKPYSIKALKDELMVLSARAGVH